MVYKNYRQEGKNRGETMAQDCARCFVVIIFNTQSDKENEKGPGFGEYHNGPFPCSYISVQAYLYDNITEYGVKRR